MRRYLDGDYVLAQLLPLKKGRLEARIVKLLIGRDPNIIGRYWAQNGISTVTPTNPRIPQAFRLTQAPKQSLPPGQVVVLRLEKRASLNAPAVGCLVETLGAFNDPGIEIQIAVREHSLPITWSDTVLAEAKALPKTISQEALEGRRDLRHLPFVTIDDETAKDFDDAVYCKPGPNEHLI